MYEQQILRILLDVGAPGISVKKLAKHVYNHYCTLFYQPDFDEVYRFVRQYLTSRSRSQQPMIERAEKWGHYRLKSNAVEGVKQQMLQFGADCQVNTFS